MENAPSFIRPATWAEFTELRRSMPKSIPFTEAAARRIIKKLEGFHSDGWDVEFILGAAIENGWRSVFIPHGCPNLKAQRAIAANRAEELELARREREEINSPSNHEARRRVMEAMGGLTAKMKP